MTSRSLGTSFSLQLCVFASVCAVIFAACVLTPTEEPFYAPDFTLTALDGESITLSHQRGRWIIINFWATWCAPCIAEMPTLQTLAAERSDMLTLYGINVREPEAAISAFVDEHRISFPILIDPPDSVLADYLVMGLPQTLVVNPGGEIVWRQFGPLELDSFGVTLVTLTQ